MAMYLQQLYYNIRARYDRSRPRPNTKDVTRRVLIHTPCLLWLAYKVLGQVGDLTVPDAVRKHVEVNYDSSMSDM